MNVEEATGVLPQILEANFEGQVWRVGPHIPPGMQDVGGWLVEADDVYCFCRVGSGGPGFIWLRLGIARNIPKSNDLAFFVATSNRDLMVGRAYLALAAREDVAMVVLEDTAFIGAMSWEHQATFADLAGRIVTAVGHAAQFRRDILGRFGGRPYDGDDWNLLLM